MRRGPTVPANSLLAKPYPLRHRGNRRFWQARSAHHTRSVGRDSRASFRHRPHAAFLDLALGVVRGGRNVVAANLLRAGRLLPGDTTARAGRFSSEPGRDHEGEGEAIVCLDYGAALAIHRLREGPAVLDRQRRLSTSSAKDNRASAAVWWCSPRSTQRWSNPCSVGTPGSSTSFQKTAFNSGITLELRPGERNGSPTRRQGAARVRHAGCKSSKPVTFKTSTLPAFTDS